MPHASKQDIVRVTPTTLTFQDLRSISNHEAHMYRTEGCRSSLGKVSNIFHKNISQSLHAACRRHHTTALPGLENASHVVVQAKAVEAERLPNSVCMV